MNNDLVSRSELKKAFEEDMKCGGVKINEFDKGYDLGIKTAIEMLDNAPTIEIPNYGGQVVPDTLQGWRYEERPQGEWKRHDEWRSGEYIGGFYHVNCPYDDGYYSKWETNFCPNCGLPMKKGGAE